jgi:hypothetical protein
MAEPRTGTCEPWVTAAEIDAWGCCLGVDWVGGGTSLIGDADDPSLLNVVVAGCPDGDGQWSVTFNDLSGTNDPWFALLLAAVTGGAPTDVILLHLTTAAVPYIIGIPVWAVTATAGPIGIFSVTVDTGSAPNPGTLPADLVAWESQACAFETAWPLPGGAAFAFTSVAQATNVNGSSPTLTPAQIALFIDSASNVLYHLTGKRFPGVCSETVRPCAGCTGNDLPRLTGWRPFNPVRYADGWVNNGCCGDCWRDSCACDARGYPTLPLPNRPVSGVTQVWLDGVDLTADVRIDEYGYLVRTDGEGWPCCQNMLGDPTVVGDDGWEIEYQFGVTPPPEGKFAAAVLACELAKSCVPNSGCRLPTGVSQVTRQGVTVSFERVVSIAAGEGFGIPEIDMFIALYPKPRPKPFMLSPDIPRAPRRTNT